MARKRICIIAFKPVRECIHVLRQIEYLGAHYDLDVIGYGEPDPLWQDVRWHAIPEPGIVAKLGKLCWYAAGRLLPALYDAWFWTTRRHVLAYRYAVASGADAIHANDWQSLPIAIRAARATGARVVLHMHEYAEEERTDSVIWRTLVAPAIRHLIKQYSRQTGLPIDACITVCEPIAERYRHQLGIDVAVVFNAPKPVAGSTSGDSHGGEQVRMIHHGYAKRGRGLHNLIHALARTDQRYALAFMLMDDDPGYIDELKQLAYQIAPNRVTFREPVSPADIVHAVSQYDMGLCVIEPSTYNNTVMLPNKLFEYIQGGIAVCVGPSPAMVGVVEEFGVGVVSVGFDPATVARTLNRLTWPEIAAMKRASRRAASVLNADVEMGKIVAIYDQLLGRPREVAIA